METVLFVSFDLLQAHHKTATALCVSFLDTTLSDQLVYVEYVTEAIA